MTVSVLFPLILASASAMQFNESTNADPRVRVWLNSDAEYERGDRARVYVRATDDGYLVVLHADTQGRVRVLFPLDPGVDSYVRAGESFEVRGRGDRDAFLIEDRSGNGLVLAAWSPDPFRFDQLSVNNHWDYRVIAPGGVGDDREAGMLDVVQQMTLNQFFEYDAAPYIVGNVGYSGGRTYSSVSLSIGSWNPWCFGCFGWHAGYRSGVHFSIGIGNFGFDYWNYDPWYDPFYYDPFYRHRWYYRPLYVRPVIYYPVGWWYDPYWWKPRYYRHGIGIHTRFAGCWSSWCRRDAHPRYRLGVEPGWATGWATNWPQSRWDGGPTGRGTGTHFGMGGGTLRQAMQRTATVYNPVPRSRQFEQPQSNRISTVTTETRPDTRNRALQAVRGNEPTTRTPPGRTATNRSTPRSEEFPTQPQRARVRPGVGSEVAPPVSTTEPRRERVVPNFERESQPGRSSISEPTRARVNPNTERQAEPPGRGSISEPMRSRVNPNIERQTQPGRSSISEPTRARVNPNTQRQAEPPGRGSISEPTRSRANPNIERQSQPGRSSISEPARSRSSSGIERQPTRSSIQPPGRSEVRRSDPGSFRPDRSGPVIQRNGPRNSVSSSPPRQSVTQERSSPSVRYSSPSRPSGGSSRISGQPRSSGSSGSISRPSGSTRSSASSAGRGIARRR